jgi:putative transposase
VQAAEGPIDVEIPQVRETAEPFVSKLFPRGKRFLRTEPLKAMVIGAFVRGLSMRDAESLCEEAGLGRVSKSTASRICKELRDRFAAFMARDLSQIHLVALFLDAIHLPVRPSGATEGVLCAWGITEAGERVLLAVMLGMRESEEDWLALGRDLTRRGLPCPQLIVSDGAPGLIKTIENCWSASDRQRCTVHRLRNLLAKLPERQRDRVRAAYWQALDEAESIADGQQRMRALIGELSDSGYAAAAACLTDDLDALLVHLKYPLRHRRKWRSTDESVKGRASILGCFRLMDRSRGRRRGPRIASCGLDIGDGRSWSPVSGVRERRRLATSLRLGVSRGYASAWAWSTPERSAGSGTEACRAACPTEGL